MADMRDAADLAESSAFRGVQDLVAKGDVIRWSAGSSTTYRARIATSLAEVEDAADRYVVRPTRRRRPGRRTTTDGSRVVRAISPKQREKIATACNTIARHLDPGAGRKKDRLRAAKEKVRGRHLVWDAGAGAGDNGDWRALIELVEKASPSGSRHENVSSIRLLMDLAAHHGWVAKTERHDPDYTPIPVEWMDIFNAWRAVPKTETCGVKELLRACSRMGITDPGAADFGPVVEHVEDTWEGGEESASWTRQATRATYRALQAAGELNGPEWDGLKRRSEESMPIVRHSDYLAVAQLYGADTDQTGLGGAGWPQAFEAYPALVDGEYGLRSYCAWATAPAKLVKALGLRARHQYPDIPVRGISRSSKVPYRWTTLKNHLRRILYVAGWMEKELGVDWATEDLRALLDMDNLRRFYMAVSTKGLTTDRGVAAFAKTLGRMASPWAQWIAHDAGDEEASREFWCVSALLYSQNGYRGEPSWLSAAEESIKEEAWMKARATAKAVEAAWTRRNTVADHAHDQAVRIRDALVRSLEACYGSLDAQLAALRAGEAMGRDQAIALLDLNYWQDQLVTPLRPSTSARLTLGMRKHLPDFSHVWAEISGRAMKTGSNSDRVEFAPNYHRGNAQGIFDPRLYTLYVLPGGAHDTLVRRGASAYYVTSKGGRINQSEGITTLVRRALRRAFDHDPDVLGGVTYEEVKPWATGHRFRHMFGTKMVALGLVDEAARQLGHSGVDMVKRIYSAQDESSLDPSVLLVS